MRSIHTLALDLTSLDSIRLTRQSLPGCGVGNVLVPPLGRV